MSVINIIGGVLVVILTFFGVWLYWWGHFVNKWRDQYALLTADNYQNKTGNMLKIFIQGLTRTHKSWPTKANLDTLSNEIFKLTLIIFTVDLVILLALLYF